MQKSVLVICSNNKEGSDFLREKNQTMLIQLLGDDFIAEFMGHYPDELPKEKMFDAVLFAGCNVMTWLFNNYNYKNDTIEGKKMEKGMESLSKLLNQDGIVIFIENQRYIEKVALEGKSYELSIPLEEMKLRETIKDDATGLKQYIIKSWEKIFQLERIDNYFVYKVKSKEGGKYKKKTFNKRKISHIKRKNSHKRKTFNKRKFSHKKNTIRKGNRYNNRI